MPPKAYFWPFHTYSVHLQSDIKNERSYEEISADDDVCPGRCWWPVDGLQERPGCGAGQGSSDGFEPVCEHHRRGARRDS